MVFLVVFGLYLDPFLESGLILKLISRYLLCVIGTKRTFRSTNAARTRSNLSPSHPNMCATVDGATHGLGFCT